MGGNGNERKAGLTARRPRWRRLWKSQPSGRHKPNAALPIQLISLVRGVTAECVCVCVCQYRV